MKNNNNEKFEKILILLSFAVAAVCAVLYAVLYEKSNIRSYFIVGFTVAFVALMFLFGRYLNRKKIVKRLFSPLIKKITSFYNKIASKVKKILQKKYDDKLFVKGKVEIKLNFKFFSSERNSLSKTKVKLPKYSSLETDKEKIRFLYTIFLRRKSSYGYRVDPARTPDEIKADFPDNDDANALFDAYPKVRYTPESAPVSKETLSQLEERIKP